MAITTVFLASPAAAQGPRPAPAVIAAAVDSLASRVVTSGVSPGFGVAIVMDGRPVFVKAYGWADATGRVAATDRTLWYLASTSKSFMGFAVSLLAHEGKIDFDAPITALLPGAQWPQGVDAAGLTLPRFLSHTSYINDFAVVQSAAFTGAFPESEWPRMIRFARPSGNTDLVYTNFGYNVAAMVIDRVRTEGWKAYLERQACARRMPACPGSTLGVSPCRTTWIQRAGSRRSSSRRPTPR
jgi:CubicO group peptidase (beta-lactamase class C family)